MNRKDKELKANRRTVWINCNIFLSVYFITGVCYGELLNGPVDTTAVEGESVILPCKTDLQYTVFWYFNEKEIFYGGKISLQYASYFSIKSDATGEYSLVIPNANSWYNGQYTCADDEGEGERRSAWLTVTDSSTTVATGEAEASHGTNANTAIVAGCIIVGIVVVIGVIVIIVIGIIRCRRKKQQNRNGASDKQQLDRIDSEKGKDLNFSKNRTVNDDEQLLPPNEKENYQTPQKPQKKDHIESGVEVSQQSFSALRQMWEDKDRQTIENSASAVPVMKPLLRGHNRGSSIDAQIENDSSQNDSSPQQGSVAKPRNLEEKSNSEDLIPGINEMVESNRLDGDEENANDDEHTQQMASDSQQENENSNSEQNEVTDLTVRML